MRSSAGIRGTRRPRSRPAVLLLAILFVFALSACAYILPASWRSFRVDPDDAAPAITRALDTQSFSVATFDQASRQIVTNWVQGKSGVDRKRERFIISWERDAKDKGQSLTVYVRQEAQDQDQSELGVAKWGSVYHETARESALLDLIAKELAAASGAVR